MPDIQWHHLDALIETYPDIFNRVPKPKISVKEEKVAATAPENMSKEKLEIEVYELRRKFKDAQIARDSWFKRWDNASSRISQLEKELFEAKKSLKQDDVRRVFNRVLKLNKLPILGIPRHDVGKEVFLSSLSNHLHNMLSKDVPNDE